ncbi:MAG TPA: ATP-binding cassette domain-containing protein [Bryobacteraceae bacterium]|nr:ATP-binding cassette domain-containing protein [Bryobacteraceae bacterium]
MTPGDSTILRFEDVSLHFDATVALDHVSFEIHPGETRVVLGAAGSGKTMLLKVAVGLVKPDSGKVWLFGQEITQLREQDLLDMRARVGILFQEGGLFDSLTVAENVAYPLINHRVLRQAIAEGGNGTARSVEDRVRESLRFVELEQTLDKFPAELSGGMRRRVGIARAVVSEPALLLYDSPTAGLDPITANTIVALILKERDLRNTATIMVTHRYQDGHLMANFRYNPNSGQIERAGGGGDVSQVSTKFLVMEGGRLVFEGAEAELQASQDPYVRKFLRVGGA